jgi:pectinesterase
VRSDGGGSFTSVQAALDSFPSNDPRKEGLVVLSMEGYFRERVYVYSNFTGGVFFNGTGNTPGGAVIVYNVSGSKVGTFSSWTVKVDANDFTARFVTFVNDANGYNKTVAGQSVALDVEGDRAIVQDCALFGAQDTLYTGANRLYARNTYINGSCDSIFGLGSAVFQSCALAIFDTVTAQRGNGSSAYLFLDSDISPSKPGTLLGRPWGNLSQTVFSSCRLSGNIDSEGWGDWNHGCTNHTSDWCDKVFYAEYNSTGPGAPSQGGGRGRVWWSRQLNASEAGQWTADRVLGGWVPQVVEGGDNGGWRASSLLL